MRQLVFALGNLIQLVQYRMFLVNSVRRVLLT